MTATANTTRIERLSATPNILDPNFPYTPAAGTDVRETFKRFGWKEPSRTKQRRAYRALNARIA